MQGGQLVGGLPWCCLGGLPWWGGEPWPPPEPGEEPEPGAGYHGWPGPGPPLPPPGVGGGQLLVHASDLAGRSTAAVASRRRMRTEAVEVAIVLVAQAQHSDGCDELCASAHHHLPFYSETRRLTAG